MFLSFPNFKFVQHIRTQLYKIIDNILMFFKNVKKTFKLMSTRIHKETQTNLNEKLILLESFFFILQLLHMHDIH